MKMSRADKYLGMIGNTYSMLTLQSLSEAKGPENRKMGNFTCACGNSRLAPIGRVEAGLIKSCGCVITIKHGMRYTPEWQTWNAMKGRCLRVTHKDYPRYGGRGIGLCAAWADSFEAFYEHIGPRPDNTTIDRIDNNLGYFPGNVRWATASTQACNRLGSWRVRIGDTTYPSMAHAAREHAVSEMTIMRWCCGYQDKRRPHLPPYKPRGGCKRWRAYDT